MEPNTETTLTDVNNDCLEKVLRYLSVGDLLNVADTNTNLKEVAKMVFIYKYGGRRLNLKEFFPSRRNVDIEVKENIEIHSWKRSYQLLRCFGDSISKLDINLLTTTSSVGPCAFSIPFGHLLTYISEYCAESLTEIKIEYSPPGALDPLEKPFSKVEKVHIGVHAPLDKHLLRRSFPNVRSLIFMCFSPNAEFTGIDIHFPNLEHADLRSPYRRYEIITIAERTPIYSFLRLNPQLRSLELPFISDEKFLQTINESVPHLRSLSLNDHFDGISTYNGPEVHFKHVNKFGINFKSMCQYPKFPLSFDKLEELQLGNYVECHSEFYDFLVANPSIRKITLETCFFPMGLNVSRIAHALPVLEEADMSKYCSYTPDEVYSFVDQFKNLQKFRFNLRNIDDHENFINHPRKGWQIARFTRTVYWQEEIYFEITRV